MALGEEYVWRSDAEIQADEASNAKDKVTNGEKMKEKDAILSDAEALPHLQQHEQH